MKKEDLTTRLVRNFFHIQGPFDECRQEVIYKACARSMVQIFYSSFFLFLFYLLFGRFIEIVRTAMPYLYFLMIFALSLKARYSTRGLHLEDDDQSEITQITYNKRQIKFRSWLVGTSIPTLYLFILFSKKVILENLSITDFFLQFLELKMIALFLLVGLGVGSIFGTMTYYFLSEHEEQ
mgnify:FL=1